MPHPETAVIVRNFELFLDRWNKLTTLKNSTLNELRNLKKHNCQRLFIKYTSRQSAGCSLRCACKQCENPHGKRPTESFQKRTQKRQRHKLLIFQILLS